MEGLRPVALDLRGHGGSALSPGGYYGWDLLARDVLAVASQLDGPGAERRACGIFGAGHSAGGSALLLAEAARPGTFDGLWAWEPIMTVPGSHLRQERGPRLAAGARSRRDRFASLDEARAHFRGRGIFAELTPEALEGYLASGLVEVTGSRFGGAGAGGAGAGGAGAGGAGAGGAGAGRLRLACPPEVEARVYEGASSHDAWGCLGDVRCPVRVAGGELSAAVPPLEAAEIAGRLPRSELVSVQGAGHFGPFQHPDLVAADISAWLARQGASTQACRP